MLKLFKNVKATKAAGNGQISGKFLKDWALILANPISELCYLSVTFESFPDVCKIAKVKPLFEKGSKTNPSNYRPISLLPLLSTVSEIVALHHTKYFFKS